MFYKFNSTNRLYMFNSYLSLYSAKLKNIYELYAQYR